MKLAKTALVLGFVAQLTFIAPAFSDCALPKAPAAVPDGSGASKDEMDKAKASLETYRKAIAAYLTCVEQDTKTRIAEMGSKVDMIRQVKVMAEKRSTGVQEELQKHADAFNDQLRAWKLVNRE